MSDRPLRFFRFTERLLLFLLLPIIAVPQPSKDAVTVTLRVQQGIFLDTTLAREIDLDLAAARALNDSLIPIHPFPDFVTTEMIIATSAPWNAAWKLEQPVTGNAVIDSLGTIYGLSKVDTMGWGPYFLLTFTSPMQIRRLADLYKKVPGVTFAEQNGYIGDGNNIEIVQKEGDRHFAFSRGDGDCPAGCIDRYYWYITVHHGDGGRTAVKEAQGARSFTVAKIYRWNIPARYAVTMFPSLDSMLSAIASSPQWWVRRHAAEGVKRLYQYTSPWVNEDLQKPVWDTLRVQALRRIPQVIAVLTASSTNDADMDVRAAATTARAVVLPLSVPQVAVAPSTFDLLTNYPNPFNPSTTIVSTLRGHGVVTIDILDLLGRTVETPFHGDRDAGEYRDVFDAGGLASGIYLCRLRSANGTVVRRMQLLR